MGFMWNLIGMAAIMLWTAALSFMMFYTLKQLNLLRIEAGQEFKGQLGPPLYDF